MSRFADRLAKRLNGLVLITPELVSQLEAHHGLLKKWNAKINLTSIEDLDEAVDRHYAEPLFLGSLLKLPSGSTVVDIGSGAGFPGTPIAAFRPDWHVTMVESHARKAVFIKEATRSMPNVTVRTRRIEDVQEEFSCAVMRAVNWHDLVTILPKLAPKLGFLVAAHDFGRLQSDLPAYTWQASAVPWDPTRVVASGELA
ncbi:MAG TPA: 16S rRNA (guanine(527)-N(7))-methyltransferase RsmG [Bryobacteraceae bacterium]|nr:16S rRNA (guanine(527)-N(7))-methyltransferase RsmG [Bryobacteraceae bacterium]